MKGLDHPQGDRAPAERRVIPCIVAGIVNERGRFALEVPAAVQAGLEESGFAIVQRQPLSRLSATLLEQEQSFLLLCLGEAGISEQLQAIRACRAQLPVAFESIIVARSASAKEIAQAVELGVIEVFTEEPLEEQVNHVLSVVRRRLTPHRLQVARLAPPVRGPASAASPPAPLAGTASDIDPRLAESVQSLINGAKQLSDLMLQVAERLSPESPLATVPPAQVSPRGFGAAREDASAEAEETEPQAEGGDSAESLLSTVRLLMLLEHARYESLPVCTERDIHWQILMFLVEQSLRHKEATVTAVCYATSAPFSTAIRKIDELAAVGWLSRRVDPRDRRRYIVELSQHGRRQLVAYLRRIANELGRGDRAAASEWNG